MKAQWMKAKSQRLKERYRTLHREANKQVKRPARTDERLFMDNLTTEAKKLQNTKNKAPFLESPNRFVGGSTTIKLM